MHTEIKTRESLLSNGLGVTKRVVVVALSFVAMIMPAYASAAQFTCPSQATGSSRAYLPDCRGYELVTPFYKEAQSSVTDGTSEELSEGAPRLLIRNFGTFSESKSQTGIGGLYELGRAASEGWQSRAIGAPFSTFPLFAIEAMTPDFTHGLWVARTPGGSEREDFYLRNPDGEFIPIGPGQPFSANERVTIFAGASDDLSHVVLQAFGPRVWPGDTTAGHSASLYEYSGTRNTEPQLIGISDSGKVKNVEGSHLISNCGTYLGSPDGEAYNAISHDGTTVLFTALECGTSPPVNELFARLDNGQSTARTVAISEPSEEDCEACNISNPMTAHFRGASLDGSKIVFATEQPLLNATGSGENLYEYDFNGPPRHRVKLLSSGDGTGARVQGVVRVSEDGSHVYFVAQGVLTGNANIYGDRAQEGAENLYVATRECPSGVVSCSEPSRQLSFIGRLSELDSPDWANSDIRPAQATPDGRFLVFQSIADLTPDQKGHQEAGQLFEYDAQTGGLVRVSRGREGYNEDGNTSLYAATIPVQAYYEHDYPTLRFHALALSADGAYVFFMSEDALLRQAVAGVRNVYEYHQGTVSLISDGHDRSVVEGAPGVELLGTDASGKDVFFTTSDQLVPQDTDTQQDFYDARIGGGIAPVSPPPACSENPCQGPLVGALRVPTAATTLSEGEMRLPTVSGGGSQAKSPSVRSKKKKKIKTHKKTHGKSRKRRAKKAARGRR